MKAVKYRVRAWGATEYPDLDYETNEYPFGLGYKYPMIDILRLTPVPLRELLGDRDALAKG